ncbi:MAG TPA: ATP-binding protein [Anaerolineales bacterium]|nr:ATP-binding protein [Anaerolineales bacterium]
MKVYLDRILDVPTSDPDDARRRRLLNILLIGVLLADLLGLITVAFEYVKPQSTVSDTDLQLLLGGIVISMLGIVGIYQINRRFSGRWAALLFLLLLTIIFVFTDSAEELANGRSLFLFTLPITIASLILAPQASFLFAGVSSAIVAWLAISIGFSINWFVIFGFFLLALVSWLSARSLEAALYDLRAINANLDRVVAERTQALAESLTRERQEAGRNQAILNSIADGVIVFDRNWNATLANPAIRSLLELLPDQVVGKSFKEIIQQPGLSPRSRMLLQAMMEHETQPPSFRVEWNAKTLSVSAAQVYDTRDGINVNIGTVAVFRDFTREAELEKLKSTFVAIVSHELRTPLNAILGYSEMFKESVYGPMNEKQVNMADRIMKNTKRLLGLINDLLDQAQMEAGKLTIQMASLKPADLLESLHGLMDKTASDKNLRLTSEIDPDLPEVLSGDAARLQQILVNLINNAIKFTEQGSIRVRLFRHNENKWGIVVSDTGSGIPPSEIPHIFDTFRQVDDAATRIHGGFGLGLAIVKQLVNMMNGEIEVESIVGEGSTFMITLPLVIPERVVIRRS